jgi:hypothetical protein
MDDRSVRVVPLGAALVWDEGDDIDSVELAEDARASMLPREQPSKSRQQTIR